MGELIEEHDEIDALIEKFKRISITDIMVKYIIENLPSTYTDLQPTCNVPDYFASWSKDQSDDDCPLKTKGGKNDGNKQ